MLCENVLWFSLYQQYQIIKYLLLRAAWNSTLTLTLPYLQLFDRGLKRFFVRFFFFSSVLMNPSLFSQSDDRSHIYCRSDISVKFFENSDGINGVFFIFHLLKPKWNFKLDILCEFSEISDRQSTWLHLIASRAAFLALSSEFLMAKLISSISERKVTTSVSKDLLALDMLWFWPMVSCKIKSEIILS